MNKGRTHVGGVKKLAEKQFSVPTSVATVTLIDSRQDGELRESDGSSRWMTVAWSDQENSDTLSEITVCLHREGERAFQLLGPSADDVAIDEEDTAAAPSCRRGGLVDRTGSAREAAARVDQWMASQRIPELVIELSFPMGYSLNLIADAVRSFAIGLVASSHRQNQLADGYKRPESTYFLDAPARYRAICADSVAVGVRMGRASAIARDLAGAPSSIKTPEWLAQRGAEILLAHSGVTAEIYDEHWLAERGFGGILAVGGGSSSPPRLLVVRRKSTSAHAKRVLLVGKGVTFDTGGISVKPAANLHLMRTDMAGAAAVIAGVNAFLADSPSEPIGRDETAELDITVVVACAENMLSGTAYRPGDIITHYDGTTSEITNTDAEGRMVLADALAYGIELSKPDLVVDVATLTGAAKVGLGLRTGAMYATDAALATMLSRSASANGESLWRLPLDEQYQPLLKSELADIRQAPGGPGSITAALFLQHFVGERRWAHLDIAGPARAEENYLDVQPVATGFGARTIAQLLRDFQKPS